MFEDLMRDANSTFSERYLKVQVSAEPPRQPARTSPDRAPAPPPNRSRPDDLFTGPVRAPAPGSAAARHRRARHWAGCRPSSGGPVPEVGRNDPCPCGSGKKYKKCHGAGA